MHFDSFSFGSIQIDGTLYEHDVVIDRGEIRKRKKKAVQEISGTVRPYAALDRRRDSLEMPSARRGQRSLWTLARDAGSRARSRASQDQVARPAHQRGHRDAQAGAKKHECNSSRDVLSMSAPLALAATNFAALTLPGNEGKLVDTPTNRWSPRIVRDVPFTFPTQQKGANPCTQDSLK
jgi:hypothetical protein